MPDSDYGNVWFSNNHTVAMQPTLRLIINTLLELNRSSTSTEDYKRGFEDAIIALEALACVPSNQQLEDSRKVAQRNELLKWIR